MSTVENSFQAKKIQRAERFKALAQKNKDQADQRFSSFRKMQDMIPMGQPILIGHHSERGHRSHLKRIDGHLSKMSEHLEKSEYYERRAENALNNNNIYLDDPQAEEKIEQKLARLKALQTAYKNFNKTWKSKGLETALDQYPGNKERLRSTLNCFCKDAQGEIIKNSTLPSYLLVNLNAQIKRYEAKFTTLIEVKAEAKETEGNVFFSNDNVTVKFEDMRVNVYFKTIPEKEVREKLKRSPVALKWSPSRDCWTRKVGPSTQTNLFKQSLINAVTGV